MQARTETPTFRKWIELEDAKQSIAEATESAEFPNAVFGYLSVAFGKKPKEGYWKTSVFSLMDAFKKFTLETKLPLLALSPKDGKEPDWEYPGRTWNKYSHILAQAYGWSLEYIGNLEVEEALGHIQEILTDSQLEQEFYYSLSEVAYPYNKATKEQKFKPLPRPHWMRPASKPTKQIKIKRSMLPVGYVIDTSGLGVELGGWNEIITKNETKKTKPPRDSQTLPDSS